MRKGKSPLRPFLAICLAVSATFAQEWHWTKDDLALNPSGVDLESLYNFTLGDLNNDGLMDIVGISNSYNMVALRGLATEYAPYWEEAPELTIGLPNPCTAAGVTLADLDGDGTLDIVFRERNYSSDAPLWRLTYWTRDSLGQWFHPLGYFRNVQDQLSWHTNEPVFRDCDGDKDLDLVLPTEDELGNPIMRFYRNIGNTTFPVWQEDTTRMGQVNQTRIGYDSWSPFLAHMNGDTLLDLGVAYIIEGSYNLAFYPGILDSTGLTWSDKVQQNLLSPPKSWFHGSIQRVLLFDMNQDKRDDLIILEPQHTARVYLATGRQEAYLDLSYFQFGTLQFYWLAPVYLFDYDKDSILEMLIPHARYFFVGWDIWYQFYEQAKLANWTLWQSAMGFALDYGSSGNHFSAQILDLDRNGLSEVVYSDETFAPVGHDILRVYENSDLFLQGVWFARDDLLLPFRGGKRDTTYSEPAFADLNGDGEQDLFITERIFSGNEVIGVHYCFFEAARVIDDSFRCVQTWVKAPHWLSGLEDTLYYHSTFADIDQDGDQDLIFGTEKGTVQAYLNIGDAHRPKWQKDDSVFPGIEIGRNAMPTFGDLDEDGRLDLFLANREGKLSYYRNESVVHVDGSANKAVESFQLEQNYPNPFNLSTVIRYELPNSAPVNVKIYDTTGRLVRTLLHQMQTAGIHSLKWDGTNSKGNLAATGIYICRIEFTTADGRKVVQSRKMSLLR